MTSVVRFEEWQEPTGTTAATTDASGNVTFDNDVTVSGGATVSGDLTVTGNMTSANQGLVFIKSQTIGSGVSSVTVSDAFSSTFDNYRIVMSGMNTTGGDADVLFRLNGLSTNYFYSGIRTNFSDPLVPEYGFNVSSYLCGLAGSSVASNLRIDVFSPNLATKTSFQSVGYGLLNITMAGSVLPTTAYTGFDIFLSTGTMTGGTIRVYGYAQ